MSIIKLIITNGKDTEWREVDPTDIVILDLSDYDKSRDLYDIQIENEGNSIVKEGNVRYVYDNPGAPTLPPKKDKPPWEMF
jgi:hypothetical protein